jgi:hypothetical protein
LLVLKEMEENIRSNLTGRERLQVLPVVMNNLAYFYYRKHKYPAAHSYMTKAMTLERKAYGAVDFATHLRMAAVSARLSHHTVSLKHCKAALKVLQEAADLHGGHGGAPAAARTYHAHLAVVYHNLAVQMAYLQQLQHAAGTAKVAQQLVTQALPAKHRWVRCPPAHACALDAHHCLRTACALPAHCLRTACALHAHCMRTHYLYLYLYLYLYAGHAGAAHLVERAAAARHAPLDLLRRALTPAGHRRPHAARCAGARTPVQ